MAILAVGVLAVVVWSGTATVDVMITEPGGEHPYVTDFQLEYAEGAREPLLDSAGRAVGYRYPLVPRRVALKVHQQIHGLLNCPSGDGEEVVPRAPAGSLAVPAPGENLLDPLGAAIPRTGAYQLVLPRAVGAFACGGQRTKKDRWVVIGSKLFHAAGDIDMSDVEVRSVEADGSQMRGSFHVVDPAHKGAPVQHEYHVTWALQRRTEP